MGWPILFISIFILCIIAIYKTRNWKDPIIQVKADYEAALKSDDKTKALELGRKYYSMKRTDKKLTIYDEQAITNDLSTMKNN